MANSKAAIGTTLCRPSDITDPSLDTMHTPLSFCRTIRRTVFLFQLTFTLILGIVVVSAQVASSQPGAVSVQQTVGLYQKIPGLTSQQKALGATAIARLNYNGQRILRKICTVPGVDFDHASLMIERLQHERFTFEQVLTFEALTELAGMNIEQATASLTTVKQLSFDTGRAFRALLGVQGITLHQAMALIPTLNSMPSDHVRAARALFQIGDLRINQALNALPLIVRLQGHQAKAAEAFAGSSNMTTEIMVDGLNLLARLYQNDARNARFLFSRKGITAQESWDWLVAYFALPAHIQEAQYESFSPQKKSALLQALYEGGKEILWKINNLHAITNQNGYEISEASLGRWSMQQLENKYQELQPAVRARFDNLSQTNRATAIGQLKRATAAARVQTARDLTVANSYAIMAQGSELYDSSFRDIMVPVLLTRIQGRYQGDLLNFLQIIDPENLLVADFIASCAQKGKLTEFFPEELYKQKEILSLITDSALKSEDSILLFSATFTHLLKVLSPEARTYLITLMSQQSESETATNAKLINVILQYYLQTSPELLGREDRILISRMIVRHGAVDMERYQTTPFAQWKEDGRLGSVSMYHPDDDGRQSFASNARMLLASGYKLNISEQYSIPAMTGRFRAETRGYLKAGLPSLFQAMQNKHFAIAFTKDINGIRINHTQFVYSTQDNQMEMLRRFILSGDEMLAQRGHSYWRSEQITEPLGKLIESGRIKTDELQNKQRFLSLGSCGGVKVYTNLTRLFASSVDLLATIGTGLAMINDPYNKMLFEIVAKNETTISWKDVARQSASIFQGDRGQDYLLPGSLTAMLHKMLDEQQNNAAKTKKKNFFQRISG
ncbi:hypothetical protein JWJ90_08615 [Desulfobulbus rhabdoformis]|uniref:hypothetical protein n=1 Tax=Desulfobulbus rhabdoformis TaxID=34032 RepID=UPI0019627E6B|nr:hypothetical protein [Desulfobulbus rhabdoformis]MBM9614351.1 hypothetical protein [Desulfobulbus rhabdoformis]